MMLSNSIFSKLEHSVKTLLSSFVACLLLWICLLDLIIETTHPLRYLTLGGYITQDQQPIADKIIQLKRRKDVDTLLLGSSLPMCAAGCADARFEGRLKPHNDYDLYCYSHARFLESETRKISKKTVSIFNFSGMGCMISDAYKLFRESKNLGVRPKLVILAIAPRDFLDNTACRYGETPYFDAFERYSRLNKSPSISSQFTLQLAKLWHFFDVRQDYKTLLLLLATDLLGRSPDLYAATNGGSKSLTKVGRFIPENIIADSIGPPECKERDIQSYTARYLPLDMKRYNLEFSFFRKLLVECRTENIDCVVVAMPLAKRNFEILPEGFRSRYISDVSDEAKRRGFKFLNLVDDSSFSEADFRDTCHPNGAGGLKIFRKIAHAL